MNVINEITRSNSNTFITPIRESEAGQIKKLTLSILGSEKNLDKILDDKNFKSNDLYKFTSLVSTKYQSQFQEIITPIVKRLTPENYLDINSDHIRVSVQAKHTWTESDENYARKLFTPAGKRDFNKGLLLAQDDISHEKEITLESKDKPSFCFPTRPHQDLSNNGFRSSHVLIFYFQITDVDIGTCDLEVANFKTKKGLYEYSNKWGYCNQLTDAINSELKWYKPKELSSKNVLVIDSLAPHRSTLTSKKVRLAVNVKIHPDKLNYLFDNQENVQILKARNEPNEIRLNLIKELLSIKVKYDVQLNYELGLINFLLNNEEEARHNFNNLCLFKLSEEERNKMIAGGFLRKTLGSISDEDIKNVMKNKTYNKLSCVDTIFNTFK